MTASALVHLPQNFSNKNYCDWFCGIGTFEIEGIQWLSSNKHTFQIFLNQRQTACNNGWLHIKHSFSNKHSVLDGSWTVARPDTSPTETSSRTHPRQAVTRQDSNPVGQYLYRIVTRPDTSPMVRSPTDIRSTRN